jgi:hypothetical protein
MERYLFVIARSRRQKKARGHSLLESQCDDLRVRSNCLQSETGHKIKGVATKITLGNLSKQSVNKVEKNSSNQAGENFLKDFCKQTYDVWQFDGSF